MSARATVDVTSLPNHAFGSRSVMWWATVCIIAIEGTVFIITIATYFYLQGNELAWPPGTYRPPDLFWPTVNVFILLFSLIPNQLVKNAAENLDVHKVRVWMPVADLFAVAFVVARAIEYTRLNVSWDDNAYGSATWTLLSFHSLHLITDLIDSLVLTALMFTRHSRDPRRLVDIAESCFYWYFVVLSWLPIYGVLYWAPRLL